MNPGATSQKRKVGADALCRWRCTVSLNADRLHTLVLLWQDERGRDYLQLEPAGGVKAPLEPGRRMGCLPRGRGQLRPPGWSRILARYSSRPVGLRP